MKTARNERTPKTVVPLFDRYVIRWPPISGSKVGWPKGVPRMAKLDDEPRRPNSPPASWSVKPLVSPIIADHSVGRIAIRSEHKNIERLRQVRSSTTAFSAQLAKTCRAQAIKAHPTQRAGSGTGSAQVQRDYFQECVRNASENSPNRPDRIGGTLRKRSRGPRVRAGAAQPLCAAAVVADRAEPILIRPMSAP